MEHLNTVEPERLARCGQLAAALTPVQPALDYIEDHLHESLHNPQLVGQTPTQYVMERRVTRAVQRLLFTERSIEQIAETTGFSSRFYFTRLIGLPPAEFRRSKRV